MSINMDHEDMMLTDCRNELNNPSHNNDTITILEPDLNTSMNYVNYSNNDSNSNNASDKSASNIHLQSLRRRLSLNLNAERIHSMHTQINNSTIDMNASYEVSSNGTLRTKGFEIRNNGFSVKHSHVPNAYPQFHQNNNINSQAQQHHTNSINSMSIYSTSPSPLCEQSPSSPNISDTINSSDLIELGTIGKGSCGTVRRALHISTCHIVALKNIAIHEKDKRLQLVKELRVLTTLNSPYLITFNGAYYEHGITTLVLEYMNRNSLAELVKQYGALDECLLQHIAIQVIKGLSVLHASKHVHRDIKPGNILINHNMDVKIADFGVLTALNSTADMATTYIGTTAFMSPERIMNEHYTASSDIWSFGIAMIYCATGELPYKTDSNGGMFGLIKSIRDDQSPNISSKCTQYSDLCRDFISKCLYKQPHERWSGPQLLAHPWLINADNIWIQLIQNKSSYINSLQICQQQQSDMDDCDAICTMLLNKYYPVNNYRRSLFELARFQKIANELGMTPNDVQYRFEYKYSEKFNTQANNNV